MSREAGSAPAGTGAPIEASARTPVDTSNGRTRSRSRSPMDTRIEQAITGRPGAIAGLVTLALHGETEADALGEALRGRNRAAHVVGITGPPGVGKSTLVSALAQTWPGQGRVAVLAIDPTSPLSGGSILGDRVRMKEVAGDERVYVRSVASRGRTNGLAVGIERVIDLLSAIGFATVLIETVGIGQVEIEITSLADTTVAVLAPGQGDIVQAVKSGLNEVADVFVVNKADLPGAEGAARDLRRMTRREPAPETGQRPVVCASATDKTGVDAVGAAIAEHYAQLVESGELALRQERRGRLQLLAGLSEHWTSAVTAVMAEPETRRLATAVASGHLLARDVLPELLDQLTGRLTRSPARESTRDAGRLHH